MTVDASTFGRHGNSFGTVDVLVSSPACQGLAHAALGVLVFFPVTMKKVSKYIENFANGEIPHLVLASHTQSPHVVVFTRACPPHRFPLGLHVQTDDHYSGVGGNGSSNDRARRGECRKRDSPTVQCITTNTCARVF